MSTLYSFTRVSSNAKTGPIPVSMSQSITCDDACPLKSSGCYAKLSFVGLKWRALDKEKKENNRFIFDINGLAKQIELLPRGQLMRYGVAGDLPGVNNQIDSVSLGKLVTASKNKRVFSYSHKGVLDKQGKTSAKNREAIAHANANGFTINLSGNNLAHADELKALNIGPVVSLISRDKVEKTKTFFTPAGNKAIVCPATYKSNTTCANCGLCAVANRSVIVLFPSHGAAAKSVDAIANTTG